MGFDDLKKQITKKPANNVVVLRSAPLKIFFLSNCTKWHPLQPICKVECGDVTSENHEWKWNKSKKKDITIDMIQK